MNRNINSENYKLMDDMSVSVSNCSRFSRRYDVNAFNMMDYRSCENCRHFNEDNRCIAGQNTGASISMR